MVALTAHDSKCLEVTPVMLGMSLQYVRESACDRATEIWVRFEKVYGEVP